MESPTSKGKFEKDKKERKTIKRMKRLFDDIQAGAVIQVERRISKVTSARALNLSKITV